MSSKRLIRPVVNPSWAVASAVAFLGTSATTLVGLALSPLIGRFAVPVTIFCPSVMASAWYGGLRAAALNIMLSTAAAAYLFNEPLDSFRVSNPTDDITLLIFVAVGI